MTYTDLSHTVLGIIEKTLNGNGETLIISLNTALKGHINSISFMNIAINLEKELDFKFEDNMLSKYDFVDVHSLVEYIEIRIQELEKMKQIIKAELMKQLENTESETVNYITNFKDVGLDSSRFIKMIFELEKQYDFEFDMDNIIFGKLNNIYEMAKYIESQLILSDVEVLN